MRNVFYIKNARHFAKSKTICVTFLCTKIMLLYVTQFFKENVKLAFIHKKHNTLRYVTFLNTKSRHFAKIKTICVTVLFKTRLTLCVTQFFIEFLKLAEGG